MFVLHTAIFGYDMWISKDFTVTDKIVDALVFDQRDNRSIKENYYSAKAGYRFAAKDL